MRDFTATDLIGKYILIGFTFYGQDEAVLGIEQHHGRIVRANADDGIVIRKRKGEEFAIPFAINALHMAPRGSYRLRLTDEIVDNPDFIVEWAVHK